MTIRKLTRTDVGIKIECLDEDTPIEGNYVATDDPEDDRACERAVIEELAHNPWAWCMVKVTVGWSSFEAHDYLGCCNYDSEEDFRACTYFDDMVEGALDNLNQKVADAYVAIKDLLPGG